MVKRGFREDSPYRQIYPHHGIIAIEIRELERLEVDLPGVRTALSTLPVGSTLDTVKGRFVWQPGPGFFGLYNLRFVLPGRTGEGETIHLAINITPHASHVQQGELGSR
jgi:hypothetical protein